MNDNWELLATQLAGRSRVINLTGPLGVGKTVLLQRVREKHPEIVILDNVDAPAAVIHALQAVAADARFVIASRRRLTASPQWSGEVTVVEAHPWPAEEIKALAGRDAGQGALALRLSGGLPLVAHHISRLAHDDVAAPTAVAAVVATDVLERLRREGADQAAHEPLLALAGTGAADEEMLRGLVSLAQGVFEVLADLSIVRRDAIGLTMLEPYRTILDLGLGWRRPLLRRAVLTKGLEHRSRQIALLPGNRDLGRLMDRTLMLLDDPTVREMLFPASVPSVSLRPAGPEDFEEVARLTRLWAERNGLRERSIERLLDTWWDYDPSGFMLAATETGGTSGFYHVLPARDDAADAIEPLLQQLLPALIDPAEGLVLGMAFSQDGASGVLGAVLRHALATGSESGRLLVSTQWPPYQQLCQKIGLTRLGYTRHDLYHCGRANGVYALSFAPEGGRNWVSRLGASTRGVTSSAERWDDAVRHALTHLTQPAQLARNPLIALPALGSPQRLVIVLRRAIEVLASAADPRDAEAARLLTWHYVDKTGHETALRQANLSRATYFRRISHGVGRVGEIMQAIARSAR